jgi:hypothetical protein
MSEPLDLDSIRARVKGASLGPWRLYDHTHILKSCRCLACRGDATVWEIDAMRDCDEKPPNVPEGDIERCKQSGFRYEDAEFIVHARFDVPRLLAEIERLQTVVAAIESVASEYLPDAIGHNALAEIMAGIARQRDWKEELNVHFAETARKLTDRAEKAEIELDRLRGEREQIGDALTESLGFDWQKAYAMTLAEIIVNSLRLSRLNRDMLYALELKYGEIEPPEPPPQEFCENKESMRVCTRQPGHDGPHHWAWPHEREARDRVAGIDAVEGE